MKKSFFGVWIMYGIISFFALTEKKPCYIVQLTPRQVVVC